MKIELTGANEVLAELKTRQAKIEAGLATAVQLAAQDVRNECVRTIQTGSRTGKIYTRNGRKHQASAEGEPPKTDTGRLVNSLAFRMLGKLTAVAGAIAGNSIVAEYAAALEFGTRKMAARPFLVKAVEKITPRFRDRVQKAVEDAGK